jgi:hypothetical protein
MTADEKLAKLDEPPHPVMVEGCDAYFRDKKELLEHRQQNPQHRWVAYHGGKRIDFGSSQRSLFIECVKRGIPRREIFIMAIDPSIERVMDVVIS